MTDLRFCLRCEKPSYSEGVCPRCNASGLLTAEQVRALAPFVATKRAFNTDSEQKGGTDATS